MNVQRLLGRWPRWLPMSTRSASPALSSTSQRYGAGPSSRARRRRWRLPAEELSLPHVGLALHVELAGEGHVRARSRALPMPPALLRRARGVLRAATAEELDAVAVPHDDDAAGELPPPRALLLKSEQTSSPAHQPSTLRALRAVVALRARLVSPTRLSQRRAFSGLSRCAAQPSIAERWMARQLGLLK